MLKDEFFEYFSKEFIELYRMKHCEDSDDNSVSIHEPQYINFSLDKVKNIKNEETVYTIRGENFVIHMWKNIAITHMTIL